MPGELVTLAAGVVGFAAGVAADWARQWSANWFARRAVRGALRAEIAALAVNLNFYILRAIEAVPNEQGIERRYFEPGFRPGGFDYYWNAQREKLLKLPEWARLRSWHESLATIHCQQRPALFVAIMLFESMLIPPLRTCLDGKTAVVVKSTLGREDVQAYKLDYLLGKTGGGNPA